MGFLEYFRGFLAVSRSCLDHFAQLSAYKQRKNHFRARTTHHTDISATTRHSGNSELYHGIPASHGEFLASDGQIARFQHWKQALNAKNAVFPQFWHQKHRFWRFLTRFWAFHGKFPTFFILWTTSCNYYRRWSLGTALYGRSSVQNDLKTSLNTFPGRAATTFWQYFPAQNSVTGYMQCPSTLLRPPNSLFWAHF